MSSDDLVKLKMEAVREQHRKRLAKKGTLYCFRLQIDLFYSPIAHYNPVAFPRMDSDGYTSLQVLVDNDGMLPSSNKRPVSLGVFTGRIAYGTGSLQGKEYLYADLSILFCMLFSCCVF